MVLEAVQREERLAKTHIPRNHRNRLLIRRIPYLTPRANQRRINSTWKQ
jgi:hypothetical protein